jgi:hypothetical protein
MDVGDPTTATASVTEAAGAVARVPKEQWSNGNHSRRSDGNHSTKLAGIHM